MAIVPACSQRPVRVPGVEGGNEDGVDGGCVGEGWVEADPAGDCTTVGAGEAVEPPHPATSARAASSVAAARSRPGRTAPGRRRVPMRGLPPRVIWDP
jgi:hypothetical protein